MVREGTQVSVVSDPNAKLREVRLGLVLYGGVALAIYINGVCAEFFRAVRGRGVYRLIKALTDSDVVVDIVSGTSAGGINGMFLAYALCNQREFADCALIWREHGGIRKLLRNPLNDPARCVSVLDSEGYYQPHIEAAFAQLGPAASERHGYDTAIQELDLFVTATDVDGRVSTEFDDAGHAIDVKDHRRVFLLKHRAGRKEPFRTDQMGRGDPEGRITYRALAKLARMTSAFPAAFAPVGVGVSADDPLEVAADARLREWGWLDREAYFLDGGVLDNKPFTHTIRQIFTRVADREVDRKLIYVEPHPERFEPITRGTNPNFLQAILLSLIGIPSYESIADDLRLLRERNSKLEQYGRLVRRLQPLSNDGSPVEPSAETLALYRRSRLVALSRRVVHGLIAGGAAELSPDQKTRAAHLIESFDRLVVDQTDTEQANALFRDLDAAYRLRRITRVVYLLHDLLFGSSPASARRTRRYQDLLRVFNRQSKAYEIVLGAMESLVDSACPGVGNQGQSRAPEEVWAAVHDALDALLADDQEIAGVLPDQSEPAAHGSTDVIWLPQAMLGELNRVLKARVERLSARLRDGTQGPTVPAPSVLLRLDALEAAIVEGFLPDTDDPVRRAYAGFEALDAHVFPLELVGGLDEKDVIETVRISPRDAQRGFSRFGLSDKVAGDALYHFAGFFKRSWRSNDILWGRLDAACQLTELLLVRARVAAIVADDDWRARGSGSSPCSRY